LKRGKKQERLEREEQNKICEFQRGVKDLIRVKWDFENIVLTFLEFRFKKIKI